MRITLSAEHARSICALFERYDALFGAIQQPPPPSSQREALRLLLINEISSASLLAFAEILSPSGPPK